jgi:hypothetical protein
MDKIVEDLMKKENYTKEDMVLIYWLLGEKLKRPGYCWTRYRRDEMKCSKLSSGGRITPDPNGIHVVDEGARTDKLAVQSPADGSRRPKEANLKCCGED